MDRSRDRATNQLVEAALLDHISLEPDIGAMAPTHLRHGFFWEMLRRRISLLLSLSPSFVTTPECAGQGSSEYPAIADDVEQQRALPHDSRGWVPGVVRSVGIDELATCICIVKSFGR